MADLRDPFKIAAIAEMKSRYASIADKGDGEPQPKSKRERRIRFIFQMMCEGLWVPGTSARELASVLNVSRDLVGELATEAHHRFQHLVLDQNAKELALAEYLTTMRSFATKARLIAEETNDARALDVAGRLLTSWAEYAGLKPAVKLEPPTGKDGKPLDPSAPLRVVLLPEKDLLDVPKHEETGTADDGAA